MYIYIRIKYISRNTNELDVNVDNSVTIIVEDTKTGSTTPDEGPEINFAKERNYGNNILVRSFFWFRIIDFIQT